MTGIVVVGWLDVDAVYVVVIDLMHPPHRGSENWMIGSNRWTPSLKELSLAEAVAEIDRLLTLESFYGLLGREKFFKYNFAANDKYGTVEFRQAEASGDGARATAWVVR